MAGGLQCTHRYMRGTRVAMAHLDCVGPPPLSRSGEAKAEKTPGDGRTAKPRLPVHHDRCDVAQGHQKITAGFRGIPWWPASVLNPPREPPRSDAAHPSCARLF